MSNLPPLRPIVRIDVIDVGPEDLYDQLPVRAELLTFRPGADRDDYAIAAAQQPITFHATAEILAAGNLDITNADPNLVRRNDDGTFDLTIFGLVMAPRIAGAVFNPDMKNFPVALAYVIDNSLMKDDHVDFEKCYYAAVAFITVES